MRTDNIKALGYELNKFFKKALQISSRKRSKRINCVTIAPSTAAFFLFYFSKMLQSNCLNVQQCQCGMNQSILKNCIYQLLRYSQKCLHLHIHSKNISHSSPTCCVHISTALQAINTAAGYCGFGLNLLVAFIVSTCPGSWGHQHVHIHCK